MKRLLFLAAAAFPLFGAEPAPVPPTAEQVSSDAVKVEQAADAVGHGAQVLDVRTKAEWDKAHLPNAKLISLADENFAEKVKATMDPAKPVLIYCRSGRCTAKAAKQLRDAGFAKVDELDGGIEAWQKASQPVETSTATAQQSQ